MRNWLKIYKCIGGSHMQRILDIQITLENGNIDGGWGGECNFSLIFLKENCWLLQLPSHSSYTFGARIEIHACIIALYIVIMATHL